MQRHDKDADASKFTYAVVHFLEHASNALHFLDNIQFLFGVFYVQVSACLIYIIRNKICDLRIACVVDPYNGILNDFQLRSYASSVRVIFVSPDSLLCFYSLYPYFNGLR